MADSIDMERFADVRAAAEFMSDPRAAVAVRVASVADPELQGCETQYEQIHRAGNVTREHDNDSNRLKKLISIQ